MKNKVLLTDKNAILKTQISNQDIGDVLKGEVVMKINKYALTSNNVTYAVIGHQVKYWQFFPAKDQWGIVPVWGFAEVVNSQHDQIKVGEKIYGYFPMAEFLKVKAGRVNENSFFDINAHRAELPPIYNSYQREKTNYGKWEDFVPIIRPLFTTSFLIDVFLQNENYFNAENLILTSASSKTALGLAFTLKESKDDHKKKIIGLTSKHNVDFVESTGFYDEVLDYDSIDHLNQVSSVVIDFAGSAVVNQNVFQLLQNNLIHLCKVGLTDWTALDFSKEVPNSKFFFAPDHAQTFFKKHGSAVAYQIVAQKMIEFFESISSHMKVEYLNSFEELESTYVSMVKGKVDPSIGYIMKPS